MLLSGCSVLDEVGSWFSSSGKKSNLRGVRIPVMSLESELKVDASLATQPVLLPPPYMNPDWPQPGGYASNAMYHLAAPGRLRQAWSEDAGKGSDTDSHLISTPVMGGGLIYALDAEAHIWVFRANDGHPVWNRRLAPKNGTDMPTLWGLLGKPNTVDPPQGMGGGVAYDAGKIFVTSGFGVLRCIDARTGRDIWQKNLKMPIVNAPVVNGGRIFVSTHDNHLYAMAETDGRTLWEHQGIAEAAGILASTNVAVSGETVIVPYTSGELYALSVSDGRAAWNEMLTRSGTQTALSEIDDIAGRPVIDRDMVFAISHSGVMVAININSGERVWSRDIGGVQTPWAAGDFVYVLTLENKLLCLQRKDGKVKWIHQLPRFEDEQNRDDPIQWTGPVLVSDRLIVVSSDGKAYSISPYTGQLMGKTDIPDGAFIPPVVANDTLYLLTNGAQLVTLR